MNSKETQLDVHDGIDAGIELAPAQFFSPERVASVGQSLARLAPIINVEGLDVR